MEDSEVGDTAEHAAVHRADVGLVLGQNDEAIPPAIADAARLTRFAVTTRYPGVAEPVTAEEHRRAVAIAEAVVTWADERVGEGSSPTR